MPSEPGNERIAIARVADALAGSGLSGDQLERLKTAVAEATMNAIEHGNHNQADVAVDVTVTALDDGVAVVDHRPGWRARADPDRRSSCPTST